MPQHLSEQYDRWIGRTLNDGSGSKIGKIADIYTDDDTGQPEWLAVTTGHFGSNVSFVPLAGARPAGDDIQVEFPKNQVKEAPNAGADSRLSPEEEGVLYAHYGLDYDEQRVRLQRWSEQEVQDGNGNGAMRDPATADAAHGPMGDDLRTEQVEHGQFRDPRNGNERVRHEQLGDDPWDGNERGRHEQFGDDPRNGNERARHEQLGDDPWDGNERAGHEQLREEPRTERVEVGRDVPRR